MRQTFFLINARTDVFIQVSQKEHNGALVAQVLSEHNAYAEAGAEWLFRAGVGGFGLDREFDEGVALAGQHHGQRDAP